MIRRAAALCACGLGWFGCATAAPPTPDDRVQVSGATLQTEDGARIEVEAGQIGPDGAGEGTGARAQVGGGDAPPLDVTSERTSWDLAARTARFTGDVVARRGALELRCDALDVTLAGGRPARITDAVATGSVRVVRGEQAATATRATLDAAAGRLVLTGAPTLSDGPHTMAGETIQVWLDEDRVECSRCRVVVRGEVAPAEAAGGG